MDNVSQSKSNHCKSTDYLAGIADCYTIGRNVFRNDSACTDYTIRADSYAW